MLQFMGSQRVGHNLATEQQQQWEVTQSIWGHTYSWVIRSGIKSYLNPIRKLLLLLPNGIISVYLSRWPTCMTQNPRGTGKYEGKNNLFLGPIHSVLFPALYTINQSILYGTDTNHAGIFTSVLTYIGFFPPKHSKTKQWLFFKLS